MLHRLAPVAAMLAAALAPTAAAAQTEQSSTLPNYNLVQLSVAANAVSADEFQARTMQISSCGDAVKLGKAMDAKVERKRFVHDTELPPQLRPVLKNLPNGMATPVMSEDGETLHVLVVCSRA
ncbi:hypothetical protein [Porphyrobacter sp. YT40]|uniref:hypothetical protein n=1 Tax=Porphyrobacter sp. YT40 TaxID=2547601 RepID=UPI001142EF81|nr:hypothetical protein [Porphyrobacter sp. YT40]QDH34191.1 hypothetical protein E2E27_07560 [Porphyrobacter sp. YT40]